MDVHIRWMTRRDIPEVVAIEKLAFEFPWTDEEFIDALRQTDFLGMVAENSEQVVGFMVYRLEDHKLHLLSVAAHWQHRECGIGSQLMEKLKSKLRFRNRITVDVRETNLSALLFFKACGFEAVSVIRQPWPDVSDDAYRMVYRVPVEAMEVSR